MDNNEHYYYLELPELKNIYTVTHSSDVLDVVYGKFGIKGLVQVDIGYAIARLSNLLETDPDQVLHYIATYDDLSFNTLMSLLFEIFVNTELNNDIRYDNLLRIISFLPFNGDSSMSRERAARKFIINVLAYVKNIENHNSDTYSDVNSEDIYNAILNNTTVSDKDLVSWLSSYPDLYAHMIINYKTLYYNQPSYYNDITTSPFRINIHSIMRLFEQYYQLLLTYNETATSSVDILDKIVSVMADCIDNLIMKEDVLGKERFDEWFKESAYSFDLISNSLLKTLTSLFWYVWLVQNMSLIEDKQYWVDVDQANDSNDIFTQMHTWRSEVVKGSSSGLIYSLYYYELYESFLINTNYGDDLYNSKEESENRQTLNKMISDDILSERVTMPVEFELMNYLNETYPTVTLFQRNAPKTSRPESADVATVLSELGL